MQESDPMRCLTLRPMTSSSWATPISVFGFKRFLCQENDDEQSKRERERVARARICGILSQEEGRDDFENQKFGFNFKLFIKGVGDDNGTFGSRNCREGCNIRYGRKEGSG
ncbi:uncharacterized protein LOC122073232 [Macadamia integrifolia]|uniref:uncharacterized protein LOC122073232 n=1 Tax=Macadamia integrifolia TaxID=60698 RepID=UPI001C4FB434|nr:uncharacterized protein LOC122073232 [Macadamia integrifolia]